MPVLLPKQKVSITDHDLILDKINDITYNGDIRKNYLLFWKDKEVDHYTYVGKVDYDDESFVIQKIIKPNKLIIFDPVFKFQRLFLMPLSIYGKTRYNQLNVNVKRSLYFYFNYAGLFLFLRPFTILIRFAILFVAPETEVPYVLESFFIIPYIPLAIVIIDFIYIQFKGRILIKELLKLMDRAAYPAYCGK